MIVNKIQPQISFIKQNKQAQFKGSYYGNDNVDTHVLKYYYNPTLFECFMMWYENLLLKQNLNKVLDKNKKS